ncbi:outer membrane beta-barrel protein [Myroides sp. N17-2]|uniref:outer membrane beta-barrel protein n=1 Tax=Myroides sp. N17-2 TaxID=2030799 RepID=UPI000EFC2109|nr:outer membrane beta-barrel protein [Myroides sp. N17-2]
MNKKYISLLAICFSSFISQAQVQEVSKDTLNTELQEVLIQSLRKKQYIDKAVYTFDQDALDKARYAKDLLTTLPTLTLDPVSNTVQSIKGGTTLFLINGIEASDNQMRTIEPKNVVRVEYYDVPPTRWANRASQVVNIITRNPENGYVFGADAITALDTGFVNGSAYSSVTKGKNNFGVDYSINLRDYNNRENKNSTAYKLNDIDYRAEEFRKDKFGYTNQDIVFRYTNTDTDKYTFQAKVNITLMDQFNYTDGQSLFYKNKQEEDHSIYRHNNKKYTMPSLDLYYSKKITEKDELSFNALGTYYTTRSFNLDKEWLSGTAQDVFNNETILETKQSGFVGEIAHSHNFGVSKLNSGYRFSMDEVKYDLTNLEGYSNYTTTFTQQYLYTEFVGKKNGWMYRLGASLNNMRNSSPEHTQDTWVFTPKVLMGYEINNKQSIRLSSTYRPRALTSDQLSSNVIQLQPNIVQTGNPYLKVQRSFINSANYSFNSKYFDLNASFSYDYLKDFVNSRYVLQDNRYALTYVNDANMQQYSLGVYGSIKPFGTQVLVLKVNLYPTWESIKTVEGDKLTNNYIGNSFTVSSSYKNLFLSYSFNIPVYSLSGVMLSTNENASNLFGQYKLNNWSFTAGMLFIGMPSEYKSKSLSESLVQKRSHTQIWNNKNMFIVGIGYDFSVGKKTNVNRSLQNYTKGAATF